MTPSEIKKVLSEIGGRANKKLGQHFLVDNNVLVTIVKTADIHAGDRVLEIGPGLGVLTDALTERGADVIAIEQDRRFIQSLIRANRRIVHGDAAKMDWDELIGDHPWKFISNLPYSITSLALRKALWPARRSSSEGGSQRPPSKIVVLVQREVAERAIAKNKKTSLLSLMVALASSSTRIVKRVPPGAFYPPPKVESAILEIVPMTIEERQKKWGIDPEKIMQIAKRGFAHPRKYLFSNLGLSVGAIHELPLRGMGINPKSRAEDLSPEQWAKLARSACQFDFCD